MFQPSGSERRGAADRVLLSRVIDRVEPGWIRLARGPRAGGRGNGRCSLLDRDRASSRRPTYAGKTWNGRQSRNVTTYQNAKRKKKQRAGIPSLPVVPVILPWIQWSVPGSDSFLGRLPEIPLWKHHQSYVLPGKGAARTSPLRLTEISYTGASAGVGIRILDGSRC